MINTYIQCLKMLCDSGYYYQYKNLVKFTLFNAKKNNYPSIIINTLQRLDQVELSFSMNCFEKNENKINIYYDITRLISHNKYSGINKTTLTLLKHLQAIPLLSLTPVFNINYLPNIKTINNKYIFKDENKNNIEAFDHRAVLPNIKTSPSIYHSPYHPLPTDLPHNVKKVITLHDLIHLTHKCFYPDPSKYLTYEICRSCLNADVILAVSYFTGNELMKYFQHNLNILPMSWGPTIDFSSISSNNIISFGNLNILTFAYQSNDPRKNFSRMLQIGSKWLKLSSNNGLCIFGNIEKLLLEFNRLSFLKDKNVFLIPSPDDNQLSDIMKKSSCYLYLSQAEGFGLPPLEAMYSGCPSVMLGNTSLLEVFCGWEGLVSNNASDELILNTIDKFVKNSTYRK
ncbi:MAG: glycosyltransferase, partial [archaeon]